MKKLILENIIKNSILAIVLTFSYYPIDSFFRSASFITPFSPDYSTIINSLLLAVSIIVVTACFGAFTFTYEKINPAKLFERYLGHTTTGLLMLVIGIGLEMTASLVVLLIQQPFFILNAVLIILYIGIALYDFWDLYRLGLK